MKVFNASLPTANRQAPRGKGSFPLQQILCTIVSHSHASVLLRHVNCVVPERRNVPISARYAPNVASLVPNASTRRISQVLRRRSLNEASCWVPSLMIDRAASASQILDRLEYLINLVESRPSAGYGIGDQYIDSVPIGLSPNIANANEHVSMQSTVGAQDFAPEEMLEVNEAGVTCRAYSGCSQDILDWPVFEGRYNRLWIEALIFDSTLACDDLRWPCTSPRINDDSTRDRFEDLRHASGVGAGVREDDIPHLVEVFLVNVHVKNPIFDPEYLRRMAKGVVENGLDWKAPSCLVVSTYSSHLSLC